MAIEDFMSYAQFKAKYQHGYGLATSTKIGDAYRQYRLHGTLPTSTAPTPEEEPPPEEAPPEEPPPEEAPPERPPPEEEAPPEEEVPPEEGVPELPTVGPEEEDPTVVAPELPPAPEVTPAPTIEAPEVPPIPEVTPAPTIPGMEVTPAPEYAPTEEEVAWAEMYGGTIADIIKARGEGIPEETINLMIRQQTQALTAREDENMRLMHNDMERRGITESGLVFYNEQKIKSATTAAIANSITDIQIKSALMKMASFENALGQAGQFLGYLADQSKMFYVSKMATWEAQTDANLIKYQAQISSDMEEWRMENQFNMVDWQANTQALFAQWNANTAATMEEWRMENQFNFAEWGAQADWDMALFQIEWNAEMAKWQAETDIYKMGINQAYMQDNMTLAAQIAEDYALARFGENKILLEMQLEAARLAAEAEGSRPLIASSNSFLVIVGIIASFAPVGTFGVGISPTFGVTPTSGVTFGVIGIVLGGVSAGVSPFQNSHHLLGSASGVIAGPGSGASKGIPYLCN
ncbi:hypothetical protein ES705_30412 [subsurface metagenome]